jgi:periplasmic protein TonB
MYEDNERVLGLLAVSAAVHVLIFLALGFAPSTSEALQQHNLEFEVFESQKLEPKKKEADPVDEIKELKQAKPQLTTRVRTKTAEPPSPAPPPQQTQQPAPAQEAPVDFPGLTLTSEDGVASWSTVVGNGESFKGPVLAPRKKIERVEAESGVGTGNGSGNAPRVIVKDLSRPPIQPENMDQTLVKNYPLIAKKQGIEGSAIMRVHIAANGQIGQVTTVKETYEGFGAACEKTVRSGKWQPKLDKRGSPVESDITYTCRFEVGY